MRSLHANWAEMSFVKDVLSIELIKICVVFDSLIIYETHSSKEKVKYEPRPLL